MKSLFTFFLLCFITIGVAQTIGSGNAVHFSSHIDKISLSQNWPIANFPFAVSGWIYAEIPLDNSAPIVSSHNSTTDYSGFNIQLVNQGGGWQFEAMLGKGSGGQVSASRKSKLVPFTHFNRWCHFAVIFNSMGNYDIYLNGVLQTGSYTGAATTYSFTPSGLPYIGHYYATASNQRSFRGSIDELAIYDTLLNQTQIRNRMCKSTSASAPGLVSYYKFNETTGTLAADSGPSAKNGTLTSATLRAVSGAPIGDEVAYFYPSTNNPVMKLVNVSGDTIKVANVSGTLQGMHIYTVNSAPNTQNGIVTACPPNRYHGVFPVVSGTNSVTYEVQFRRPNYTVSNSYNRTDNSGIFWNVNTITQAANGFNWSTSNRKEFITNTGPLANYSHTATANVVQFTNTSTGNGPLTYAWAFGDGATSTAQNPQHTYTPVGTYLACLTVTDSCGSQTHCQNITTTCSVTAAFGNQQTGTRKVSFYNQSTGAGNLSYLWNFGNGTTSTAANPVVTFQTLGTYWVCLQTTDNCGTITYCDSVDVVCYNLNASYTYTQSGLTASFANLSTGTAGMSYYWTFGDGSFSFTKNPVYTYQSEGTYQVCLQITDSCSTKTTCDSVTVCLPPSNNFVANNTSGFTFHFIPTTTNANNYIWNFGDGNYSAAVSPIYTYQNPGLYTVCMSLVDDCDDADTCIDVLASLFSLHESGNLSPLTVYPNPTKDIVTIKGLPENGLYTYQLTNAVGQHVQVGMLESTRTITLQSLPEGLYILSITDSLGNRWQAKVIIE